MTNICKYVIYQTTTNMSRKLMIWLARGSDDVRRHRKSRRLATRSSSDWLVPRWPCWLIGWVAEARRIASFFFDRNWLATCALLSVMPHHSRITCPSQWGHNRISEYAAACRIAFPWTSEFSITLLFRDALLQKYFRNHIRL